ncbi:MAG: EAL domain-containing protein [Acidobacteria bacterium]|nr:EAL domain-containing protein [Acidobacteriota bacterium]
MLPDPPSRSGRPRLLQELQMGVRQLLPCAHEIHGLRSGRVEAVEILTRFHEDGGDLGSVGELLRDPCLTSESRLELDLSCLQAAFQALDRSAGAWDAAFLNVEPTTLGQEAFWERLQGWLRGPGATSMRVVLEITESCADLDLEDLQASSRRLRELGVGIAVDDLGSGVASLTHMARLTPDFIKADQSLVRQAHRRPYQAALLNALAHFARRMCVGFIAEGIESREELQAVHDADVPWAQGFVYGEPVPIP